MRAHIPDKFKKAVTGRTIKAVVRVGDGGDDEEFLGLELDDGTLLVVQRDPEGNGGGFVSAEKNGKTVSGAGCA